MCHDWFSATWAIIRERAAPFKPPAAGRCAFKDANYQWFFTEGRERWQKAMGGGWASAIEDTLEKYTLCASCSTFPSIRRPGEVGSTVLGTEGAAEDGLHAVRGVLEVQVAGEEEAVELAESAVVKFVIEEGHRRP
jgi:hypothetical protein